MGERRGTKALELWCRRITEGYPGVNVQNMTTSWRDGLAFCAMIHHFRPDLIDFNSLNKDDVYGNNELAFRTAEQHLGIPALLDAEDMASCAVPDRLSILTYLSQFYQTFGGSSPSRLAMSRSTDTTDERIAPVSEAPKPKVGSRPGMRREPCNSCGLPVFLAEKLLVNRVPYHRTCFRCARCNNQLTPGNYYETEEGQYCCETCPDEEGSARIEPEEDRVTGSASHQRSLSDEQKTERVKMNDESRENVPPRWTPDTAMPDLISQTSLTRRYFMASHLLSENEDEPVAGRPEVASLVEAIAENGEPNGETAANPREERGAAPPRTPVSRINSAFPDDDENEEEGSESSRASSRSSVAPRSPESARSPGSSKSPILSGSLRSLDRGETRVDRVTSDLDEARGKGPGVNSPIDDSVEVNRDEGKRLTAISVHDIAGSDKSVEPGKEDDTKDSDEEGKGLSLVQKRLRMFEAQEKRESVDRRDKEHAKGPRILSMESAGLVEERSSSKDDRFIESCEDFAKPADLSVCDADGDAEDLSSNSNGATEMFDTAKSGSILQSDQLETANLVDKSNLVDNEDELSESLETNLITAKGIDLSTSGEYPEDLNPFKSDESGDEKPNVSKNTASTNPFDSEDEEENEIVPPKPAARTRIPTNLTGESVNRQLPTEMLIKRRLPAPNISLNPFWSDEEEPHSNDVETKGKTMPAGGLPIPKPRTIKTTPELVQRKSNLNRGEVYASNSSITSSESATTPGGTYRKKKPAPPPPMTTDLFVSDRASPPLKPGYQGYSPRTTPRSRKTKPAPPPPVSTSSPIDTSIGPPVLLTDSSIDKQQDFSESYSLDKSHDFSSSHELNMWEDQKTNKDETNRNRQSLTGMSCEDNQSYKGYTDKSVQGKWKRKKGPAPPRPIPHRRRIKVMSLKDVKLELDEIELQQQGLERQGVRLEQLIRDKCESGQRIDDTSLGMDVEELVLELFALVNEKNELFRRQAELMLLRRQQRLEEEHAEVEYQIRCLMCQPEATKTDFEKQREETLIQRLVEIVERRNEIVECLEMDRRREVEEDKSIHKHMGLFAARNKNDVSGNNNDSSRMSKTKKVKIKEKKLKKVTKKDADKDIDETEVKLKRHNKRKWF